MGHNGGGNGAGHGGKKHGAGEITVQLFQGKHHACQGRIEGSRQAGTGTAGNQVSFLHAGAAQQAGNPLARHSADLDGRPFPSQGKTGADAQSTGDNLHPENAEPFHFIKTQNDTLHLGNAGAARHGSVKTHTVEEKPGHHQGCCPQAEGNEIFLRHRRDEKGIVCIDAQGLGLSQQKAEKADTEAAENTHKYAFYKQTEAECMPVVQSHIGFKSCRLMDWEEDSSFMIASFGIAYGQAPFGLEGSEGGEGQG